MPAHFCSSRQPVTKSLCRSSFTAHNNEITFRIKCLFTDHSASIVVWCLFVTLHLLNHVNCAVFVFVLQQWCLTFRTLLQVSFKVPWLFTSPLLLLLTYPPSVNLCVCVCALERSLHCLLVFFIGVGLLLWFTVQHWAKEWQMRHGINPQPPWESERVRERENCVCVCA